jgi:hypothetical protein
MMEIYASDQSLLHIGLERFNAEHESDNDGIIELLMAVEALTMNWMRPLGVGFQIVHCDTNQYFEEVGRPVVPHHFLRQIENLEDISISERLSNSAFEAVPAVNAEVIRRAITRELAQPAPVGSVTTLSELAWTAVQVRAPTTEPIELDVAGRPCSTVSQLINGERWYFGPRIGGNAGPPARLRAVNDHFSTYIQLEIYWDLWIGVPEGRALLDAGIARVLARPGWERLG